MSSTKPDTRTRILKSAWTLLEAEGGSAVRMGDIAKAAGISRQALYLHFPARADLLIATTRYLDEVYDIESKLAPSRAAASGLERLDSFIEAWGNHIPAIYGVAKALMAMKDTDDEADAAWTDRLNAIRHGCEAAIKALKADKALSPGHTQKQATDILWTMLSVRNWEHLTGDCGWSQKQYIEKTKHMARQVLCA